MKTEQGKKYDSCPYTKPKLSLVPLNLLAIGMNTNHEMWESFAEIHTMINSEISVNTIFHLFRGVVRTYGPTELAVVLGYGLEKYKERDNWKQGFGGDPERLLEAGLRHLRAYIEGSEYDGEKLGPYNKGNSHFGAYQFTLMVACVEAGGSELIFGKSIYEEASDEEVSNEVKKAFDFLSNLGKPKTEENGIIQFAKDKMMLIQPNTIVHCKSDEEVEKLIIWADSLGLKLEHGETHIGMYDLGQKNYIDLYDGYHWNETGTKVRKYTVLTYEEALLILKTKEGHAESKNI